MRKFVAIFLILFLLSPLFASFQIGLDVRDIDSSFYSSFRGDLEFSYRMDELRFTIPLRLGATYDGYLYYLESGVSIAMYPFDNLGLFLGASLFKGGYFLGALAPDERFLLTSEAFIGWTFSFPYVYLEPRLTYYDLFSSADSNAAVLKENIKQFSSFRLSLYFGVEF